MRSQAMAWDPVRTLQACHERVTLASPDGSLVFKCSVRFSRAEQLVSLCDALMQVRFELSCISDIRHGIKKEIRCGQQEFGCFS